MTHAAGITAAAGSAHADVPPGDYVSPNLAVVRPDAAFPMMAVGDPKAHPWPYLRREIPHLWRHDRRYPLVGFASRDEASILYNSALAFRGRRALEIGCWLGWSACHLALAGVKLDIIDPVLKKPEFLEGVKKSLADAGITRQPTYHPAKSPGTVNELAAAGARWGLIFIDGNHEAPGPRDDAEACARCAEDDALILFHDLASPDVAAGLDYLRDAGWQTMVYMTHQIMGVAWRGRARLIEHTPDPRVDWPVPEHLRGYTISGWAPRG